MKTFLAKKEDTNPQWYVVDASNQVLGRLAVKVANILRGRNKPTYTPHVDTGDFVVVVNADKSVDVYFGPKAPAGKENNWVQTMPGKGWSVIFRLYSPLKPWFDKTWRPGEIELVK